MTSAYPGIAFPGLTFPGVIEAVGPPYGGEPAVTVEVAFASPLLSASPVWVDVTDYVRAISTRRGRNMELSQFDAGSLSITFDNSDGRFTPRLVPVAGQPTLRPRRAVRVTATHLAVTYPIAWGAIERWPAQISNGALTVTIDAGDAFRVLSDTGFPDSDTGQLARSKPDHYWPMQGSDAASTLADVVGRSPFAVSWSSMFSLVDCTRQAAAASVDLPTVDYSAPTLLPSGAGNSVGLGGSWASGGLSGARALSVYLPDFNIQALSGAGQPGFTVSTQVLLPSLAGPVSVFAKNRVTGSTFDPADIVLVNANGSITVNATLAAPAGTIKANTVYRIAATCIVDPANPSFQRIWYVAVNGTIYGPTTSGQFTGAGMDGELYVGGTPSGNGGKYPTNPYSSGGRFAHVAVWNRALSTTELQSLYSEWLCAAGLTADTRINRALDLIGWPALRSLDAGISPLGRDSWGDNTGLLSLIQGWVESDGGLFYMGPDGKAIYRNRRTRMTGPFTPSVTLDCNAVLDVEEGLQWVMDEGDITNVVNLSTPSGGVVQLRSEASIAEFGEKPIDMSVKVRDAPEGRAAADWRLYRYAQPMIRISGVSIMPTVAESDALWVATLSAAIGQVLRLDNLPSAAPATRMDYFIESVQHDIVRDGSRLVWHTSFDVSPVPTDSMWRLGDSVLGVLGSTTRLAY